LPAQTQIQGDLTPPLRQEVRVGEGDPDDRWGNGEMAFEADDGVRRQARDLAEGAAVVDHAMCASSFARR
jgi:catechol 2,3-dioxygenase-like lactoylglutathione lyase family enzyme